MRYLDRKVRRARRRNYNAIALNGQSLAWSWGKKIFSRTNEFHVDPSSAFIRQTRAIPIVRSSSYFSIGRGSQGLVRRLASVEREKVGRRCRRRVAAAVGYAVGNSIPASTEANLSRPNKGRTRARGSEELYEYETFPGY